MQARFYLVVKFHAPEDSIYRGYFRENLKFHIEVK
jgi:hypothetical protein